MLFSSIEFLYLFLPLTVIIYFASPKGARNFVLLCASLVFYASGEPVYILLMLVTTIADFLFGRYIGKAKLPRARRALLVCAVIFNLALLGFFKYYGFASTFLPFLYPISVALPIGISFYTFQALSYVCDVYRGETEPSGSLIDFSTYVALFPQLIAGPIVRYTDVATALKERRHSFSRAADGIRRFCAGLAKKVLIANRAGEMWERLSSLPQDECGALDAWLGAVFFAIQIYFDFSGYSDMAIGLGKIFGFDFPENFNYPYISRSITEFWRRWHITLSSFFKEYVYIPLGGNRRGKLRTYINLLAVWSLTGLWHGAAVNFILWGIYYFLLLSLEKLISKERLWRVPCGIRVVITLILVLFGWVIFASDSIRGGALPYISRMLGIGTAFIGDHTAYELFRNLPFLTVCALGATPIPKKLLGTLLRKEGPLLCAKNILVALSLLLCTARLVSSGYNPFLYFRF